MRNTIDDSKLSKRWHIPPANIAKKNNKDDECDFCPG